jgi:hypothetical protein
VEPTRYAHEVPEADDAGSLEGEVLGAVERPVALDDLGFLAEDEHDRPPVRDYSQRLVARVEDERSSQRLTLSVRYRLVWPWARFYKDGAERLP